MPDRPVVSAPTDETAREALAFCDEIERNEKELWDSGWGGYQWEHLGDATKDIHKLIGFIRALVRREARDDG